MCKNQTILRKQKKYDTFAQPHLKRKFFHLERNLRELTEGRQGMGDKLDEFHTSEEIDEFHANEEFEKIRGLESLCRVFALKNIYS